MGYPTFLHPSFSFPRMFRFLPVQPLSSLQLCTALPPILGKMIFFAVLLMHKPAAGVKWIVMGNFNQIYRARDKNKCNINVSCINHFLDALNLYEPREIHLQNRHFTWSNEWQNPTLCKLDSIFCNNEWDIHFGKHVLHALSSSPSDHCPLLLADDCGPWRPRTFKFENF